MQCYLPLPPPCCHNRSAPYFRGCGSLRTPRPCRAPIHINRICCYNDRAVPIVSRDLKMRRDYSADTSGSFQLIILLGRCPAETRNISQNERINPIGFPFISFSHSFRKACLICSIISGRFGRRHAGAIQPVKANPTRLREIYHDAPRACHARMPRRRRPLSSPSSSFAIRSNDPDLSRDGEAS